MFDETDLEKYKLTAKQILLYLTDGLVAGLDIFDGYKTYRKPIKEYWKWRDFDKENFGKDIYRLKKAKLIKIYYKNKEKYVELMPKGKEKLKKIMVEKIKLKKPGKWDKKWRMVIFDIPDKKKPARNALAEKLKKLGFYHLQKSVFVHPYDCKEEIDFLKIFLI